jgi:hypothetical protein
MTYRPSYNGTAPAGQSSLVHTIDKGTHVIPAAAAPAPLPTPQLTQWAMEEIISARARRDGLSFIEAAQLLGVKEWPPRGVPVGQAPAPAPHFRVGPTERAAQARQAMDYAARHHCSFVDACKALGIGC